MRDGEIHCKENDKREERERMSEIMRWGRWRGGGGEKSAPYNLPSIGDSQTRLASPLLIPPSPPFTPSPPPCPSIRPAHRGQSDRQ